MKIFANFFYFVFYKLNTFMTIDLTHFQILKVNKISEMAIHEIL